MAELTNEAVLALKKILIKGNKKTKGVRMSASYRGMGGSNPGSGSTEHGDTVYTLAELAGKEPVGTGFDCLFLQLYAIVDDVAYLVKETRWTKTVFRVPCGERLSFSEEVGYDTEGYVSLSVF